MQGIRKPPRGVRRQVNIHIKDHSALRGTLYDGIDKRIY